TYPGVILPGLADVFGIFLMKQFIQTLPTELEHAARVDGASEWQVYRHIIVPLSRPALAVLAIFTFQRYWNAFIFPLVILRDPAKYPVQVGLATLQGEFNTDYGMLMTGAAVAVSCPSAATPTPDDGLADDPLTAWIKRNSGGTGTDSGQKTGQVQNNGSIANLELVGHNHIGGRGFNADIYAHKGFAYIGQWGFGISNFPKFCPAGDTADPRNGVKILDLHAPGLPIVGTLRSPAWTSAEDITVFTPLFGPRQ